MALHFDYSKVSGPTDHPSDPDLMHPVLNRIIWLTMITDIGNLSDDKSVEEFAFRVGLYQRLTGPALSWHDAGGNKIEAYITPEDVRQYKGLRCNVFNTKRVSWMAKFAKMAEDEPVSNTFADITQPEKKMGAVDIVAWLGTHRWGSTIYSTSNDVDEGFAVRKKPDGGVVIKNKATDGTRSLDGDGAAHFLDGLNALQGGEKAAYVKRVYEDTPVEA